jgi:hypothetical protein
VIHFNRISKTTPVPIPAVLLAISAIAQAQYSPIQAGPDEAAASAARKSTLHPFGANTPAAAGLPKTAKTANGPAAQAGPFQPGRSRNPGDLTFQGGPVVTSAQSHALFLLNPAVNCTTPACWGNPEQFLQDLSGSDFIGIADQYTGRNDNNRYTVGTHQLLTFGLPHKLTDNNILAVVHFVASQTHQTGYDHIYHVFLPPGTDECFDGTFTTCYSPDNPNTFFFCAYHSSVDFSDIGHVLYSVEPFQNVPGCNLAPGSPNGQLVDSTASVLSHELFETITDPDGTGWWNTQNNDLFGDEIADECSFIIFLPSLANATAVFFDPPAFPIGGRKYAVQEEYNNNAHACTTAPHGN